MRPTIIIFITVLALIGCATQKTAQNNSKTISEISEDHKEIQVAPSSLDQEVPEYQVHVVQSGESLSIIAGKYGVTVKDLVRLNNISDPDLIVIGQEILVPKPKPEDSL